MSTNTELRAIAARYFESILANIEALEQFSGIDPVTQADVRRQLTFIGGTYMGSIQSIRQKDTHFQRAVAAFIKAHDAEAIKSMAEPLGYDWRAHKNLPWCDLICRKLKLFTAHL